MRKLGVGIVGLGEMGKRHAENFHRQVPEARLVAVADVLGDRARKAAAEMEIGHAYDSLECLLENKAVDAIVISTPEKLHAQAILTAARAGKAIFCEKPLALNVRDGQAVLQEVNRSGARLQVGFMRRYDPAYAAAMRRIEAGEIGTPVVFRSIGRDKEAPPLTAYQSGLNGMLFYTNSIHDFDLARWLMRDEVEEVHAYGTVVTRPELARYGDVMAATVNLRHRGGAIGNVESSAEAAYGYDVRTEIVGSKGSILVGTLRQAPVAVLTSDGGNVALADHFLTRFAEAYILEMRDFVHNILHDLPLRVTGEDGLAALAIAEAAERSYLEARPVEISTVLSGKSL